MPLGVIVDGRNCIYCTFSSTCTHVIAATDPILEADRSQPMLMDESQIPGASMTAEHQAATASTRPP